MSVLYPDVPIAAGVPSVLRLVASLTPDETALTSDSSSLTLQDTPLWGIFEADGVTLAIEPDSIVAMEYAKEEQVSTFPVEQGGFQSYNKVELPYHIRVQLTKGGSVDERANFLDACYALRATTDLFTFAMPEGFFDNGNITAVRLPRNAQSGAQLLTVELIVEEIRSSAASQFTKSTTQDPASADTVSGGAVQTKQTDLPAAAGQPL